MKCEVALRRESEKGGGYVLLYEKHGAFKAPLLPAFFCVMVETNMTEEIENSEDGRFSSAQDGDIVLVNGV